MSMVYVVTHLLTPQERSERPGDGEFEINGVFSTPAAATAICNGPTDAVVAFELDRDCTNERTFDVIIEGETYRVTA